MPEIQVLDSHVADLIAAGEVVERPASVAKELMENAIDAGATALTVEISHGGMTFLRVTDDGRGIPAAELKTAFLRHATSKLRTEYDLEAIGTLGFRGEALAAISAVSRVDVMTRTADASLGAALSLEGGIPGEVEEAGCPLGTTMVVRDLFYNTPARLKFMKKDAAEGAAVFSVVQRVALSHPEVSVKFIRDGKQELLTPGDGQLQSAVYAVLGRELALGFRPVKSSGEDMTVTGFASLPACCRGSRNWQFFFVNGRQVKSKLMVAALEEAYKNQKMVGKFPGCVLHLETKISAVDVNVHPAKTEVKFGNERQVFSAVYHAVLSALEGDRSHPALEMRNEPIPGMTPRDTVTPNQTRLTASAAPVTKRPPVSPAPPVERTAPPATTVRVQDTTYKGLRNVVNPIGANLIRPVIPKPVEPGETSPVGAHTVRPPIAEQTIEEKNGWADIIRPTMEEKISAPAPKQPTVEPPVPDAPVSCGEAAAQIGAKHSTRKGYAASVRQQSCQRLRSGSDLERRSKEAERSFRPQTETEQSGLYDDEPAWRMAGEVLDTYIIVEQGDSVFFIDKHAAHERMNFDRMKAEGYDPMAQTLLTPAVCRLSAEEQEVLLSNRELLEEFGFDVDELGRELAVRQAPFDVAVGDIEATLSEIAQKLLSTGSADPAAARDELLHTMACKAAIKGGWKSSPQELERVAKAVMSGQVKYCPHGRPVAIELTKKELEKQFKRA